MSEQSGHRSRLKQQILQHGLDPYPDYTALELLLFYAIPRQDTQPLARALLERFGSLQGVFSASIEQLQQVSGIGENAALLIHLIPLRHQRIRLSSARQQMRIIDSAESAGSFFLDLFAGKNDYEAVKKAGPGGHKEINRTNLTTAQICSGLSKPIVKQQLELLRFRNSCPAFSEESRIKVSSEGSQICFVWEHQGCTAQLKANLQDCSYGIEFCDQDRKRTLITEG